LKIHKNRKVPPSSQSACRPPLPQPKKNWTSTEYSIQLGSEVYSLREGQGRRRTLDLILSIPPSLPPITQERKTMKTHFPRERGIESGDGKQSTLVCPRVSLAEGIRITIQFIHSRPFTYLLTIPTTHFSFILPLSTSTYTPSTFRGKPTTHPLSHIITRPLWKCVSLPLDIPRDERGKIPQTNERGLV